MKFLSIKTCIVPLVILTSSLAFTQSSCADALIQGTYPTIFFDDIDEVGYQWGITGEATTFGIYNYNSTLFPVIIQESTTTGIGLTGIGFGVFDESSNPIINVHESAPPSLLISDGGDVSLGENRFLFDRSTNRLGIGTVVPEADLEIQSSIPGIFLDDTSAGSTDWYIGNLGNDFDFYVSTNGTGGPTGSLMTLDAETGYAGLNNTSPLAPLHIFRDDETQQFLLLQSNEVGTVQDRAMMYLVNNGGIRFEFNNPSLGTAWRFQAATGGGDNFEVTKVGTGQIEFRVDADGNAHLAGLLFESSDRNAKTNITPVSPDEVLDKVVQMPINQWAYKESPESLHIGPMAQDFYAAFGTGDADTTLATMDVGGVAIASIQALEARNRALENEVRDLKALVMQLLPQVSQK